MDHCGPAAEITGLSAYVIAHASRHDMIQRRPKPRKGRPSLDQSSVLEFAARRRRTDDLKESLRQTALNERNARSSPPQDGHRWLTPTGAATVLGRSRSGVGLMIRQERIPATKVGRRWWIRLDHIERLLAAERLRDAFGRSTQARA